MAARLLDCKEIETPTLAAALPLNHVVYMHSRHHCAVRAWLVFRTCDVKLQVTKCKLHIAEYIMQTMKYITHNVGYIMNTVKILLT